MNTLDLQRLSAITRSQLSAEVRRFSTSETEIPSLEYLVGNHGDTPDLPARSLIFLLYRMYGENVETIWKQMRRVIAMCAYFVELYGDGPVRMLRAPARINILGEHIDYVSYLPTAALPFGSREHDMLMLYRSSAVDIVRGASTLNKHPPFSFNLIERPAAVTNGDDADWLSFLYEKPAPAPHWSNYVRGSAYFARIKWGAQVGHGFDFLVDSAIPAGGGASSSSALVVLASAAVRDVNSLSYTPMELARDASKAEWFVGTRGGSMDHITIALAKRNHAVLISYPDQHARQIALPGGQFRWITFFSHAADKGREVMIQYNERAAVSRIVLPALIEGWKTKEPERYKRWVAAIQLLVTGESSAPDDIETLLNELPVTLTLNEMGRDYPEAFAACARSFPALVSECVDRPLPLRARALHHIGEVRRVITVVQVLEKLSNAQNGQDVKQERDLDAAMRLLGSLSDQSHASLRDLYEVSTPDVERLIGIIRGIPGAYGARLMGGGFGGNVLALTTEENVELLIARVQSEYYEPQNRNGNSEGSVMISTPGDGLAPIIVESVWREAIQNFTSAGKESEESRSAVNALLDSISHDEDLGEVWPVVVAAGKGTRSLASGLAIPKPCADVLGKPAILHVLENVRAAFGQTRRPIVIVSPETEDQIRALIKQDVTFVVQRAALGTGDAVLCAGEEMEGFKGRALVIWSTQPVIRPQTMRRTLKLSALFANYEMVLPTALKNQPYAPIMRDDAGRVRSARETHLEQAGSLDFGESNIGMFMLNSEAMFRALIDLNERYWNEVERRYIRDSGELGFPNELINYFATRNQGVFACPIADSREEQGIKKLEDLARCERFITELAEH